MRNALQPFAVHVHLNGTWALGTTPMKSSNYLFLLLLIAGPAFSAASTNGDEPSACPKSRATAQASSTQEADSVSTVPAAATRPTPVRTTRSVAPRTVSPRWHSMLPGMFR